MIVIIVANLHNIYESFTDFTDFTDFGYARLGVFLTTDFTDFTDFWLRIGVVRARVSGSVKSGKSVDNKKRGALRASMIRFFIY